MTTTTTKPARVLTEEQNHDLWELFCTYGQLRWDVGFALSRHQNDEAQRLRREADEVQERFGDLIWSLTERPS